LVLVSPAIVNTPDTAATFLIADWANFGGSHYRLFGSSEELDLFVCFLPFGTWCE
jgi:hypothetical protein